MKVMVIEDESDIREILRNLLTESGFEVAVYESGANALTHLKEHGPDVLLLDQVLPGKSGTEVVREIRASQEFAKLPIMMVTGLSGEEDKVNAFDLGADDYVTKPFYPRELTSRIRALARRFRVDDEEVSIEPAIDLGILSIDFAAHKVILRGIEIQLTLTEFRILGELLKQVGQVLTRERLRERALGNLNVTDRTIDVHMASLRKKLGDLGPHIETVRGVGYRFASLESAS